MPKKLKQFVITKTVSGREWGGIDKKELFTRLKEGLDEGVGGATEAIQEVYAVVKASIDAELTQADCLAPHHEVSTTGRVVLNRAGLAAATATLADARSKPDLTDSQKEAARQHLLRHYEELEQDPPESLTEPEGEMGKAQGEMISIAGYICGEMVVQDVPVNSSIDITTLKAGDPEPLETVIAVPATKSKRGWNYKSGSLKDIVDAVMAQGLPGFLGHQKPEDVETQFPLPVTHWVGAKFDENAPIKDDKGNIIGKGVAYFRGVVDQAASDLKRWIKAGAVKEVSIFGYPQIQKAGGETHVVGYRPLSIDWTPLGRAGMPTSIVAMGEIEDIGAGDIAGELDGSHEELHEAIRVAVQALLGSEHTWIKRVYDTYAIAVENTQSGERKLWKIPYGVIENEIELGEKTEIKEVVSYEPVSGEMSGVEDSGGGKMTWKELVAQLKTQLNTKEVTLGQVIGEMELTPEAVAGEMDEVKAAMNAAKTLAEVSEALGFSGEMDVVEAAKAAAKAVEDQKLAEQRAMVDEVLADKVKGEMAQTLVGKMLVVSESATEEQVAGEIDKLLADETVKAAISKLYLDQPVPRSVGSSEDAPKHTRTKRQQI